MSQEDKPRPYIIEAWNKTGATTEQIANRYGSNLFLSLYTPKQICATHKRTRFVTSQSIKRNFYFPYFVVDESIENRFLRLHDLMHVYLYQLSKNKMGSRQNRRIAREFTRLYLYATKMLRSKTSQKLIIDNMRSEISVIL